MKAVADILENYKADFHPVVSFDPGRDKLLLLDFTKNNKELSEEIADDTKRFTDYINLSLNSIKNLREGGNVKKGDVVGEFGIPMENGQWPPHLHFQIIRDMENWK